MVITAKASQNIGGTYAIGAVVKLTGLTTHNIRVWEKRHQAVVAHRLASGRRVYTQQQVDRLVLLKKCVDCGFSISDIAQLDDATLIEKLSHYPTQTLDADSHSIGIISQSDISRYLKGVEHLQVLFSDHYSDLSTVHLHETLLAKRPSILILEAPSITDSSVSSIIEMMKRAGPSLIIIVYRYTNNVHLNALKNHGPKMIKAPLDEDAIPTLITAHIKQNTPLGYSLNQTSTKSYPKHLFTAEQLSKIAQLPSNIQCECPHHLVDLINGLEEFERYSGECINKNDEDAALHGKIQLTCAITRSQLEYLLDEVLTLEGIKIE